MHRTTNQNDFSSRGFAWVELLVVLLVLALLFVMAIPVVGRIHRHGSDQARVAAEISGLSAAIARFKTKYGVEPPSRITLSESETGWSSTDRKIIRRVWPQFDFSLARDLNHDGDSTDQLPLNGPECLVFFLGGVQRDGASMGFSKDPADPFTVGGQREGPFVDFDPARLRDTSESRVAGFPEYVDALPGQVLPYLYFSSYDGAGYRTFGSESEVPVGTFRAVYRAGRNPDAAPHKPHGFQIVSPGIDHAYGQGGVFDPRDSTNAGLVDPADYDNLTNFHTGRLLR